MAAATLALVPTATLASALVSVTAFAQRSWDPAHGFSMNPADYTIDRPAREAHRRRMTAMNRATVARQKAHFALRKPAAAITTASTE
jgi:hypothetical protein